MHRSAQIKRYIYVCGNLLPSNVTDLKVQFIKTGEKFYLTGCGTGIWLNGLCAQFILLVIFFMIKSMECHKLTTINITFDPLRPHTGSKLS